MESIQRPVLTTLSSEFYTPMVSVSGIHPKILKTQTLHTSKALNPSSLEA